MQYYGADLILYFFIYSFIGWILEVVFSAVTRKTFLNRGFLNEPYCISYGIMMVLLIISTPIREEHVWIQILHMSILVFAVTSISGFMSERFLGVRPWIDEPLLSNGKEYRKWFVLAIMITVVSAVFYLVHPFIYLAILPLPKMVVYIVGAILTVLLIVDLIITFFAVNKLKLKEEGAFERISQEMQKNKKNLSDRICEKMWKRIRKSYDLSEDEKPKGALLDLETSGEKKLVFAQGLCLNKLLWVFIICSLVGDLIETCYVRTVSGVWMRRSGLVFGPFSVVWGIGAVILTVVLSRFAKKEDRYIFLGGFLLGGFYEYTCSVVFEVLFHTKFWDYSKMPFNIGGRTNLLFMFFWGLLSLVWIKILYPPMSNFIEKFPPIAGIVLTWGITILLAFDIAMTAGAMGCYTMRQAGIPQTTAIEKYFEKNYSDAYLRKMWPNLRDVK